MNQLPLLSVIVPVYNVAPYLDRCLRSLTEQTYDNLEILLVDDGSTDDSGRICDRWARQDSRIQVLHRENAGAGAARNTALRQARGELIGFADSDDFLDERMYACLYQLLTEDVDIAECGWAVTMDDEFPKKPELPGKTWCVFVEQAMQLHLREEAFSQIIWNKLYRRQVVEGIFFPEGNLIDDEFWTYRVIGNARRLARTEACLYAYRQRPLSAMHKPYSLKRLQGLYAQQERLAYVKKRFPELAYTARYELFFACMFSMQSCLRYLNPEELILARQIVSTVLAQVTPLEKNPQAGAGRNLLLWLGQRHFEGTCKALNDLIRIHVLK